MIYFFGFNFNRKSTYHLSECYFTGRNNAPASSWWKIDVSKTDWQVQMCHIFLDRYVKKWHVYFRLVLYRHGPISDLNRLLDYCLYTIRFFLISLKYPALHNTIKSRLKVVLFNDQLTHTLRNSHQSLGLMKVFEK